MPGQVVGGSKQQHWRLMLKFCGLQATEPELGQCKRSWCLDIARVMQRRPHVLQNVEEIDRHHLPCLAAGLYDLFANMFAQSVAQRGPRHTPHVIDLPGVHEDLDTVLVVIKSIKP